MVPQALCVPIRRLGFLLRHLAASARHNRYNLPQHLPKPHQPICCPFHSIHPTGHRHKVPHRKLKNPQILDLPNPSLQCISGQYVPTHHPLPRDDQYRRQRDHKLVFIGLWRDLDVWIFFLFELVACGGLLGGSIL
jgi:hypothetical protein